MCVRYRDDPEGQRKITTVELVVEERPWHPTLHHTVPQRIPDDARLPLRIEYGEIALGKSVRAAGGEWFPEEKVWRLAYGKIIELGLADRILSEGHDNRRKEHT